LLPQEQTAVAAYGSSFPDNFLSEIHWMDGWITEPRITYIIILMHKTCRCFLTLAVTVSTSLDYGTLWCAYS